MRDHIADFAIILTGAALIAAAFGGIALAVSVGLGLVIKGVRTVLK